MVAGMDTGRNRVTGRTRQAADNKALLSRIRHPTTSRDDGPVRRERIRDSESRLKVVQLLSVHYVLICGGDVATTVSLTRKPIFVGASSLLALPSRSAPE